MEQAKYLGDIGACHYVHSADNMYTHDIHYNLEYKVKLLDKGFVIFSLWLNHEQPKEKVKEVHRLSSQCGNWEQSRVRS